MYFTQQYIQVNLTIQFTLLFGWSLYKQIAVIQSYIDTQLIFLLTFNIRFPRWLNQLALTLALWGSLVQHRCINTWCCLTLKCCQYDDMIHVKWCLFAILISLITNRIEHLFIFVSAFFLYSLFIFYNYFYCTGSLLL